MANNHTLSFVIYNHIMWTSVIWVMNKHNREVLEITYDFIESGENYLTTNYKENIQNNCKSLHANMKALDLYLEENVKVRTLYTDDDIKRWIIKSINLLEDILLDMLILHIHCVRCIGTKVYGDNGLFSDAANYKTIQVNIGVILKMINEPDNLEWLFKV